jgi:hypothetical protein
VGAGCGCGCALVLRHPAWSSEATLHPRPTCCCWPAFAAACQCTRGRTPPQLVSCSCGSSRTTNYGSTRSSGTSAAAALQVWRRRTRTSACCRSTVSSPRRRAPTRTSRPGQPGCGPHSKQRKRRGRRVVSAAGRCSASGGRGCMAPPAAPRGGGGGLYCARACACACACASRACVPQCLASHHTQHQLTEHGTCPPKGPAAASAQRSPCFATPCPWRP